MAHPTAPPSSAQPKLEEDGTVVQKEKKVDSATREKPLGVHGDSREPHDRRIALTRPPKHSWKCVACGKHSTDIRHVCAFCLSPEPGYGDNPVTSCPRDGGGAANAGKSAVQPAPAQRPGTCEDAGARLQQTSLTKRTYRAFTESHTPAARASAASPQRGTSAVPSASVGSALEKGNVGMISDYQPDCGGRAFGDAGNKDGNTEGDSATVLTPTSNAQRNPTKPNRFSKNFTHFVSIPFGKLPAVTANATRFLEDLRSFVVAKYAESVQEKDMAAAGGATCPGRGAGSLPSTSTAAPELVTHTAKLHMTLLLLTLPRREDVEFAKELLRGAFANAWAATKEKWVASTDTTYALSGSPPLASKHRHPLVRLGGGLQVFSAGGRDEVCDPKKATVVYMGINDAAGLATVQQMQRVLHESLAEVIDNPKEAERSREVLHVTIMNKKWGRNQAARHPFDAQPIVEAFPNAAIGAGEDARQPFEIPELELCAMHRHDPESGAYFVETTVKI
ncbi:hypothetical protein JKF63_05584 [Porcisia hertigi]|uniref:A-kinase anchor protein 7-like phosphoesterase domain-containing protein n=1 Tax=Porcisia hertigi TaxID=2761500 RepID=A0A836IG76_9TRYP|nr:hypothetical protein JKF63_05584 [Porcisia hertigi]